MESIPLVTESVDYTAVLENLEYYAALNSELLTYVAGFLLFFVIVVLCWFGYKFFRIFI